MDSVGLGMMSQPAAPAPVPVQDLLSLDTATDTEGKDEERTPG